MFCGFKRDDVITKNERMVAFILTLYYVFLVCAMPAVMPVSLWKWRSSIREWSIIEWSAFILESILILVIVLVLFKILSPWWLLSYFVVGVLFTIGLFRFASIEFEL
jgi:hypothetical protein